MKKYRIKKKLKWKKKRIHPKVEYCHKYVKGEVLDSYFPY